MASLVLGVAGAALGAPFGQAGLGFAVGATLGNVLFPEKLDPVHGPRLQDLSVQGATYGRDIPIVYGKARIAGNIIWATAIREREHHEESGGKGGGPSQTQITYTYDVDLAVGLCEGPITTVTRIWADGKLIFNQASGASVDTAIASTNAAKSIRIYTGSTTQQASPLIQADKGAADTPAFRGLAYVEFEQLQLADFGNRIPNFSFEVVTSATSQAPTLAAAVEAPAEWDLADGTDEPLTGFIDQLCWTDGYVTADGVSNLYAASIDHAVFEVVSGDLFQFHSWQDIAGTSGPQRSRFIGPLRYPWTVGAFNGNAIPGGMGLARGGVCCSPEGRPIMAGIVRDGGNKLYGDSIWYMDLSESTGDRLLEPIDSALFGVTIVTAFGIAKYGDHLYVAAVKTSGGTQFKVVRYNLLTGTHGAALVTVSGGFMTTTCYGCDEQSFFWLTEGSPGSLQVFDHGNDTPDAAYNFNIALPADPTKCQVWRSGQYFYIHVYGSTLQRYDTVAGTITSLGTVAGAGGIVAGSLRRGGEIAVLRDWDSTEAQWLTCGHADGAGVALSTVVADILGRCGLEAADYNVAALTDTVRGYIVTRQMSARAALEPLMRAYRFDAVESDYKLKFVKRGGAAVAALDPDDLAASSTGTPGDTRLKLRRIQELELPRRVEIQFMDADRAYDVNTQYAGRLITDAVDVESLDWALVMTPDEARRAADVELHTRWQQRLQYEDRLPIAYVGLDPLDVVTCTVDGETHTILIGEMDFGGGLLAFRGLAEDAPLYSSSAEGEGGLETPIDTVGLPGLTELEILDINTVRSTDVDPGLYVAVSGLTSGWRGAVLYRSENGGETYGFVTSFTTGTAIGRAKTVLASGPGTFFDRGNEVTVQIYGGAVLESAVDDEDVLNGANVAVLGDEIIQFRDVVDNGDGTFTLSTLLRGRRGTESFIATHAKGERFVLLDTEGCQRLPVSLNQVGLERLYVTASIGQQLDTSQAEGSTFAAVGMEPLSPTHVRGARDGSSNLTITWRRRTRLNGEWRDYVDVPLDEDSEAYEVDIMNGSNVVRTISATSPTASYTAAQQTTDFGSAQAAIDVEVYQVSAQVGRGYVAEATI